MSDNIVKHVEQPSSIASAHVGVQSIMLMIQGAIDKGVSPDAIQKLADLTIQFQKIDAEKEFNAAFAAMQSEMPQITCSKKGPWGGFYEDLEGIMRQIRPTLKRFGFSVRFSNPLVASDKMISECTLCHTSGHSITNSCAIRPGRPNKMMTEMQVDEGTYYAGNRKALCSMLNIRAESFDEDARILGVPLTEEQLIELKRRAAQVGANVQNLFKQAGVEKWEDIRSGALTILHNFMNEKERANKARQAASAASNKAGAGGEADALAGNVPVINSAASPAPNLTGESRAGAPLTQQGGDVVSPSSPDLFKEPKDTRRRV